MQFFFLLPLIPFVGGVLTLVYHFRNETTNILTNVFILLALLKAISMAFCIHSPQFYTVSIIHNKLSNVDFVLKFQIDNLTVIMLLLINFISLIIHRYSTTYMATDVTQGRFMAQLSLLTAAVSCLVMSGNLITAFIGWQFVGLTLYMLLNHYHYDQNANKAAKKNFILNRIGDICFLIAIVLYYRHLGESDFNVIPQNINNVTVSFLHYPIALNTLVVILIFIAVMTKSAQFPFHIWLPDTMQAPTPVSAIMHAGVINSGGFLLARISHITATTPFATDIIFTVGIITVVMASFFLLTQSDTKRQLAYSTMGQMGFMIVQCGIGVYTAAIFHLIAHGFYKASLFLAAGNNIGVHKGHPVGELRSGIISLIFTGLLLAIFLVYLDVTKSLTTADIVTSIFVAITMSQLFKSVLQLECSSALKVLMFILTLSVMFIYYCLVHFVGGVLSSSITNNENSFSDYKLVVTAIVVLLQLMIWLNGLYIKFIPHKFILYLYYLSRNKLFIEEFYRKYLLEPFRSLGNAINFVLYNKSVSSKNLKILSRSLLFAIAIISLTYSVVGIIYVGKHSSSLNILINQLIFIAMLIAANRAQTIRMLNYYFVVAQINVVNMSLFSTFSTVADIAVYQIINSIFIFIAINTLLHSHSRKENITFTAHNTLVWSSLYFTILLFLGLGVPGTATFISEVAILYSLTHENLVFLFIAGIGFLFLAIATLRALQVHVFNLKSSFLQKSAYLYPIEHAFIILCISANIFNGLHPMWLLTLIRRYLS